jgi:hypothetical protein
MMRYGKMLILCGAFISLGMPGREARATFLVQVTATLNAPNTHSSTYTVGQSSVTLTSNSATTDLDLSTNAPVHDAFGSTTVQSTNTTGSDTFSAANTGYSWTLTFAHVNVVDGVTTTEGAPTTITVTGSLSGSLSAYGSTLTNSFGSGPLTTPQALTIDGTTVYVMLDPYTPPGTPTSPATPTFDFSVGLSYNPGFFHPAPEPGTMALMGIGGGLFMLVPRFRRRIAKKAA